jgi:hypothetical protein
MDPKVNLILELVPKILDFIKGFHAASGSLPTAEQIIEKLNLKANQIVDTSDIWLKDHPDA